MHNVCFCLCPTVCMCAPALTCVRTCSVCLDVWISASVCACSSQAQRHSVGLHEGAWWQSAPLIGRIRGALKPFAYIWNFWISKPLFSIQISSACLTDGQFQCDPGLFACDLYCRDSCILFGCSHWLLSRFFSLILLACSLCRNSWNIHGWTVAFPYLYVQLLAAVLLCRAILIVGIGRG